MISPELFNIVPSDQSQVIKALFVSHLKDFPPVIVKDAVSTMFSTFFPTGEQYELSLDDGVVMYMDTPSQCLVKSQNFVSTFYLRYAYSVKLGTQMTYSVFGNTLFLSKKNPITHEEDGYYYSVPYSIVQDILEVYDTYLEC